MRPVIAASVVAALAATAVGAAPVVHALDNNEKPVQSRTEHATVAGVPVVGLSPDQTGQKVDGRFNVPGLSDEVVAKFAKYVTLTPQGRYEVKIPSVVANMDPAGARATRDAVRSANRLISEQRKTLAANGASAAQMAGSRAVASGVASQILPMGQHATFQADWWGMTFTLDKVAAKQLTDALDRTQDVAKLVEALGSIGVVIAPAVAATIGIVLAGIAAVNAEIKKNVTEDGLVIKALWILIPWVEKPVGPFVPAPPKPGPKTDAKVDPADVPPPYTGPMTATRPGSIPAGPASVVVG